MVTAREQKFDAFDELVNSAKLELVEIASAKWDKEKIKLSLNPAEYALAAVEVATRLTKNFETRIALVRALKKGQSETFARFLENRAELMENEMRDAAREIAKRNKANQA